MDIKDMTIDEMFKYWEEKLRVERLDDVYRACKDHLPRVLEKYSQKKQRGVLNLDSENIHTKSC